MLLNIFIILSLFSGTFVLPLLILLQLKYKKSLILKYLAFFINFYIHLIIIGTFLIYDTATDTMPGFVFILYFLSLIAFNITLPSLINSLYKISYAKFYTIASTVITILLLISLGKYGQGGSNELHFVDYILILTFLYCLGLSIISVKRLKNNIERKVGLALIVLIAFYTPLLFFKLPSQQVIPLAFLFFIAMNILAIVFLIHFLRFSNNTLDIQLDINKGFALTPRELKVFYLLSRGLSYKDIATDLILSVATVKTHLNRIYKKTETKSRFELTAKFS